MTTERDRARKLLDEVVSGRNLPLPQVVAAAALVMEPERIQWEKPAALPPLLGTNARPIDLGQPEPRHVLGLGGMTMDGGGSAFPLTVPPAVYGGCPNCTGLDAIDRERWPAMQCLDCGHAWIDDDDGTEAATP